MGKHAAEIHPNERVDPRDVLTAKIEVDLSCTRLKRGCCVIKSGRPNANYRDAFACKTTKVYFVSGMCIAGCGEAVDELRGRSPVAASVDARCQHDLPRMNALNAIPATESCHKEITSSINA